MQTISLYHGLKSKEEIMPSCEEYNRVETEYMPRPIKDTPNKIHKVVIEELDHGYVVRVGCKVFAIEDRENLIMMLNTYIKHPSDTEATFLKEGIESIRGNMRT